MRINTRRVIVFYNVNVTFNMVHILIFIIIFINILFIIYLREVFMSFYEVYKGLHGPCKIVHKLINKKRKIEL